MLKHLLFSVLILLYIYGYSQPEGYKFHPLKDNTQSKVVIQNRDGTIIIGSNYGLIKYDGSEFEIIKDSKLNTHKITALYQDSYEKLWIGYDTGEIATLDSANQIKLLKTATKLPKTKIVGITEDNQKRIWFASYGEGIYYLDRGNLINFNKKNGLPNNEVYTITCDLKGRIWFGTDEGISICTLSLGKISIKTINKSNGLTDNIVKVLYRSRSGNIIAGFYEGGVAVLNPLTSDFKITNYFLDAGEVTAVAEDFSGSLLVGTIDQGLWQYKSAFQDIHATPFWDQVKGIEKDRIYSIFAGIQGNIWISSRQFGLYSKQGIFEHWQIPIKDMQVIDHIHRFWIGTANGLYEYHHNTGAFTKINLPGVVNPNIISLKTDSRKVAWVGTFGQGLFFIEGNKITKVKDLENDNILSIDENDGTMWLATLGGVFTVTKNGDTYVVKNINKEYGIKENYIYKILVDSKKRIWLGTDGDGLKLIEKDNKIYSYNSALGKPLKTIYSIDEDLLGNIWISVASQGIFSIGEKGWKFFGPERGIRSNNISNLSTDKYGHVLLMNEKGIDMLLPLTGDVLNLDKLLGLKNFSSNLNMTFKEGNAVWIVNKNEIIYCKPLPDSALRPKVVIRNIDVMDKRIYGNIRSFPYNQNFINFNLSGIFYSFENEVTFDYMLEGYNLEWNTTSDKNIAFQKLNSGKYKLKLHARHGTTRSDLVTYSFTIGTPFWRQPLFIIFLTVFLAALAIFIIRYREKSLQKTAKLKQDRISAQFEALKSQINPHFLFNTLNTLIALIEENPSSAVRYVEQLSDFYRKILQYREQKLIPISDEISLVKSFSYLLNERYGDILVINIDVDNQNGFIVPFSLQMLLENAVKHNVISNEKKLKINIVKKDKAITVSNNLQPKLHKEPSTGFGLQSILQHYEMMTKEPVLIEKTKSRFSVTLPILDYDKPL